MRKLLSIALAMVCLMSLFAGCSQETAEKKDTVYMLARKRCETFDPSTAGTFDNAVMYAIYDGLVAFDPNGSIIPMLAESWEETPDGMSVTFKLRQDVKFHNGDAMTADDIIYSLDTYMAEPKYSMLTSCIGGYEKLDDYTVRIDKSFTYAQLMGTLISFIFALPQAYHSADPAAFAKAPIGTGPYKFVSMGADDSISLEAFEGYYGDAPGFKKLVCKAPLEAASAVISLETREVDLVQNLPVTQALLVEADDDLTLVSQSNTWSNNVLLLMNEPLNTDVNLRKAIFHGINRDSAIKLGNEGVGTPSTNMFAERVMGDYAGILEFVGYDEALAKDYLAKSDYNGEEIVLSIYTNAPLAESVQADLKMVGINIKLEQLDMNSWLTKMIGGEHQIILGAMGGMSMSAEEYMLQFAASDPLYGALMEINDEFEQLMIDISTTTDTAARRELFKRSQEIMFDMANIVPVFDATSSYSYGPNVKYEYPISAACMVLYPARIMPA